MKTIGRYIPFQLVLFLSIGIVLGSFFQGQLSVIFGLVFGGLLLLAMLLWKGNDGVVVFKIVTGCCVILIGVLLVWGDDTRNQKHHYSHASSSTQVQNQTIFYLKINQVLKSSLKTQRFYATVIQVNKTTTRGVILLSVQRDSLNNSLKVDDEILVKTTLDSLSKRLNPYVFDYAKYLNRKQIYHQLYLRKGDFLSLKSRNKSLDGFIADIHSTINKGLIEQGMTTYDLGFINALLLGKRQFLSKDIIKTFSASGAIHILAISGLHIGVLLLLLRFMFQFLHRWKYGKLLSSFCIVILLWSFAFLAGMSASVVRAVTMFTALQIGMSFNKRHIILNSIFMSMLVLLIASPNFLFDIGFQLSYSAVLSIVLLRPVLSDLWQPESFAVRYGWDLVTVSMAAQLGVLPLSLYYFHQFPILFLISNLCIIPMLSLLLFTGVFTIVLTLLGLPASWLISLFSGLVYYMNSIVTWVSGQELFLIQNIHFSGLQLGICLSILIGLAFLIHRFKWRLFYGIIVLIISFQVSIFYYKYTLEQSSELIVYHQYKKSKLLIRSGGEVAVFVLDTLLVRTDFLLRSFQNTVGIDVLKVFSPIPNVLSFLDKTVLIVDADEVYDVEGFYPNIVVLRGSPKINLERLIKTLRPEVIIADGSNYPMYKQQWEQTCRQQKTPFYDTSQKGAYILKE
ncbi:MAG: competence protein [Flavobacteriaceae bacterium]|nr:MAG: competence protein [Flavobacteriaceae bacterium]